MTSGTIYTLCRWFGCTESELFVYAFANRYGLDAGTPSDDELRHYAETGEIPRYLRDYVRYVIYPSLCMEGGKPCKLEYKKDDTLQ